MTFDELAQKILGEAMTPDPRGLRTSPVGSSEFNPQLPEYKRTHPADSPGAGGTMTKKMLRNIFRLLKNDTEFSKDINDILSKYAGRQTVSHEYETIVANNIQQIQDMETDLLAYKKAYLKHQSGEATLENPEKIKSKINTINNELQSYQNDLDSVLAKIETFPEENEVLEQNLRRRLITTVKNAASKLLLDIDKRDDLKPVEVKSLEELEKIVTTDEEMQQQATKEAVLKSLTNDDPKVNAFLRFLQNEENKYQQFVSGRTMSGKLATIEQNKQFNMMPLSAFARFYNANVKDATTIKLLPISFGAKALSGGFRGSQAGRKALNPKLIQVKKLLDTNFGSNDIGVARRAKEIVRTSGAGPKTQAKINSVIDSIVSGEEGSPKRFADIVYGNEGPITESMFEFDSLVNELLTEAKKGARCTKVTGQQPSSRSDKKYMRCARVNGKLKRVHYGDPNLRIKKSNPKKRKSFRARHKCSSAKPGTAKYFSCKNW